MGCGGEEGTGIRDLYEESARLGRGFDVGVREREASRKIRGLWLPSWLWSKKRIKLEAGNEYLSGMFSVRCLEAFKSAVRGADGP